MNNTQAVHVGMLNSFNLIMKNATFSDIIDAGVGVFAHIPDEDVELSDLDLMILYFQEHDMFEHCAELLSYAKDNFNDDGSSKIEDCECEIPYIKKYVPNLKCDVCNKRLRR